MANIQQIEQALVSINEATFQDLCDEYLYFSKDNLSAINRPGSQLGKKKTKKGTPDSFWLLPNGKYIFAEYTTKNKKDSKLKFLNKLKEDVQKCLDYKSTHVNIEKIHKIILCFNSKINSKETEQINKIVASTNIVLEFISIDTLVRDIFSRYQHIAANYLDLKIDTGQILPPEIFIEEYSSASVVTTPIDNEFFFREKEIESIQTKLFIDDIVILTGAPGVGKSKLALNFLTEWTKTNTNYKAYCISNKYVQIFEDINSQFAVGKNYILLIDDANRQTDNLLQVLSFLKSRRKGKIKILITVRDYALEYIKLQCTDYKASIVNITSLNDEQIKVILNSPDFNITNNKFTDRILQIAKGNPRIAIMAARLALKSQNYNVLFDLFDLYNKYFQSFIKDNQVFGKKDLLKTLGLVSFFFSINMTNKMLLESIQHNFGISNDTFIENIAELEKIELLESTADNSIIKISDQVLSTYFFYKVFIQDKLLDFKTLLFNYFPAYSNRFKESIVASSNDFGYKTILQPIEFILSDYIQSISDNEKHSLLFFEIFWFLKPDETLSFVYKKIKQLTIVDNPVFLVERKNNNIDWNKDGYLNLLFSFYYYSIPLTTTALELSFEYVRRNPLHYEEVYKRISNTFSFSYEDQQEKFQRQKLLFNFLIAQAKRKNPVGLSMFFHLFPDMLKTEYTIHSGSWNRQTVSFYHYKIPATSHTYNVRRLLWNHIDKIFSWNKELAGEAIYMYIKPSTGTVKEVLAHELPWLIKTIRNHFNPQVFLHCYFVQSLIQRCIKLELNNPYFPGLKTNFYSRSYKWYKLIDWHNLRNKEAHEYEDLDFDKFDRLKEVEIRYKFNFSKIIQFKEFYKVFVELSATPHIQTWGFHNSLDVIVHQTYLYNKKLAFDCLKEIQKQNNKTGYTPAKIFKTVIEDSVEVSEVCFELIIREEYNWKHNWVLSFFHFIEPDSIKKFHVNTLLHAYRHTETFLFFDFKLLEKFQPIKKDIFTEVLTIAIEKLEQKQMIRLDNDFFEKFLHHFSDDLSLPKKAYLLSEKQDDHFDHDCKDLLELLKLDRGFFIEYLESACENNYLSSREYSNLAKIWELNNAEELIYSGLEFLAQLDRYYVSEDFANVFFKNVQPHDIARVKSFLKFYLKKNLTDSKKANTVLDIYRHCFPDDQFKIIRTILMGNDNFDFFKELEFINSYFFGPGHVNVAELRACALEKILEVVNKLPHAYKYIQHKAHLKEEIMYQRKRAADERNREFLRNSW